LDRDDRQLSLPYAPLDNTREIGPRRWLSRRSGLHTSRDERQEQVRHAAYVRAYWILVTLVCLGSVVVLASPTLAVPHWLSDFSKPLAAICIVLVMTLPSAVIVWTEPDWKEVG
jgi:hypothetical protein